MFDPRDRPVLPRALLAAGLALPLAALPAAAQNAAAPQAPAQAPPPALGPHLGVSDLLGQQVRGVDGETLGEIDDIIFSGPEVTAPFALISVGGVAGIGDRLVAVPLGDIQRTADGGLMFPEDEEYLLARPTYRRPDSPTTGPLGPGKEWSQEAQAAGDPNQPMESLPGVFEDKAGRPAGETEGPPADRPDSASILGQEVPFAERERFIQAASRSHEQWSSRLDQADLDQEARQRVAAVLATANTRVDRLKRATEENWPALRDTTADAFGKLAAVWAEAAPQTARGD